jgi:hypothetical protein
MRNRSLLALVPAFALAFGACSELGTEPQALLDGPLFNADPDVCAPYGDFYIDGFEGDKKLHSPWVIGAADWLLPEGGNDAGSEKIDTFEDEFGNGPESVTVYAPTGYLISGYCVKGGAAAAGGGTQTEDLADDPQEVVVMTSWDGDFEVSHFSLQFVKIPDDYFGQWCSPGYWRQEHHLDSWEATGYSPDDKFYDVLGYYPTLTKKGSDDGAPTDPTLWEVLQNPQWYGGDAFNDVGDLLSEAHPDVDFLGVRVEDSCPLS